MDKLKKAIFNNCIKTDKDKGVRVLVAKKDNLTYFVTPYYGFVIKSEESPFDSDILPPPKEVGVCHYQTRKRARKMKTLISYEEIKKEITMGYKKEIYKMLEEADKTVLEAVYYLLKRYYNLV